MLFEFARSFVHPPSLVALTVKLIGSVEYTASVDKRNVPRYPADIFERSRARNNFDDGRDTLLSR